MKYYKTHKKHQIFRKKLTRLEMRKDNITSENQ